MLLSGETLLEPVMGVGIVVVPGKLRIAEFLVEPLSLPESLVGIEVNHGMSRLDGYTLQARNTPFPSGRVHPHPLDLRELLLEPDPTAADSLVGEFVECGRPDA